jgi:hypothetical protein
MDDDLEAGGGRKVNAILGGVNGVSTIGRSSQGDLEAGGGRKVDAILGDVNGVSTIGRISQGGLEIGGGVNMIKKQEEANNSIVQADQVNEVEREIRNLLGFTDEKCFSGFAPHGRGAIQSLAQKQPCFSSSTLCFRHSSHCPRSSSKEQANQRVEKAHQG